MPFKSTISNCPHCGKSLIKDDLIAEEKLWDENRPLSYKEAAYCYGMTYATIRHYVCHGKIKTAEDESTGRKVITHAAMREYEASIRPARRVRKSEMATA